jgi:hypothetical protein
MSFPRLLAAALCGGFLLLGSAQAQQPARELRTCKLRLAWWNEPENLPELALQTDKERKPVSPASRALSQIIEYRGEPNAVVLRKVISTELDKSGKPITQWIPYCSIPISATDTDLGVLLFQDEKQGVAQTRIFDFSLENFPYGSIQLINFTSARIAASIDGTTIIANSRGSARYPKTFEKRTICSFKVAAAENTGVQRLLRSTTMIFKPTARLMFFVVEMPNAEPDSRYHTEFIIDNRVSRPEPVPAPESESGVKNKATPAPKGKKAAPAPEAPL